MRLRFRRRAADLTVASQLLPERAGARESPPSAVTSWLRQGLRSGMCPLCRVAHKADRQYIWHFYDERSNDMGAVDEVRRAYGFCGEHMEMLRRIDVEDMKTTLGVSVLLADTFAGIVQDLEQMRPDSPFQPASCPACANRHEHVVRNGQYFLDMLATAPGHRKEFEHSAGLCFPHFKLAWDLGRSRDDREFLLSVQRRAARALFDELREHVRKHEDRYRHEPKGAERDSWLRAIWLTGGWPPPAESAAVPEQQR